MYNVAPAATRGATLVCSGPSRTTGNGGGGHGKTGKKSRVSANVTSVVASRSVAGPPDVTETASRNVTSRNVRGDIHSVSHPAIVALSLHQSSIIVLQGQCHTILALSGVRFLTPRPCLQYLIFWGNWEIGGNETKDLQKRRNDKWAGVKIPTIIIPTDPSKIPTQAY